MSSRHDFVLAPGGQEVGKIVRALLAQRIDKSSIRPPTTRFAPP